MSSRPVVGGAYQPLVESIQLVTQLGRGDSFQTFTAEIRHDDTETHRYLVYGQWSSEPSRFTLTHAYVVNCRFANPEVLTREKDAVIRYVLATMINENVRSPYSSDAPVDESPGA